MKQSFKKLLQIGGVALILKILLGALAMLAIYFHGISRFHTLWLGAELLPVNQTIRTQFGVGEKSGVLVNHVLEHSPAGDAGL